jgi:hypothetical protein
MCGVPTRISVRVIARDGKFLGDDIGGAQVTVRDAWTKELLAQGVTTGTSGPNGTDGVMCVTLRRGQPLPTTGASVFDVCLDLDRPRLLEFTAYGPLAARQSANTVSATQWVYPGKNIVEGDGFLLEIPGLIVQIVDPPTHYAPAVLPELYIRANVAMMCGCPIEPKSGKAKICCELPDSDQPWLPEEFEVKAIIRSPAGNRIVIPLVFTQNPPQSAPGQFTATWIPPASGGVFEITVYAYQAATGNTGVDVATLVAPSVAPEPSANA